MKMFARIAMVLGLCVLLGGLMGGCANKEVSELEGLFPIPERYLEGDVYVNRQKRYKVRLPGPQWEFVPNAPFDLLFHARDYPNMLVVEGYTDYVGFPAFDMVAERLTKNLRGTIVEKLSPADASAGFALVNELTANEIADGGTYGRYRIVIDPRKSVDMKAERVLNLYALRRNRRLVYVGYLTAEETETVHQQQVEDLVESLEAL